MYTARDHPGNHRVRLLCEPIFRTDMSEKSKMCIISMNSINVLLGKLRNYCATKSLGHVQPDLKS